jgi:hypothetical protein
MFGSTAGKCLNCPAGYYQDGKGQTKCVECEKDTYLEESGKASKADCQSCPADRSTGLLTGNANNNTCLCRANDYYQNVDRQCIACPVGADCSAHDGLTLTKVVALPGYWRANATTDIFTDCKVAFSASLNASRDASTRCIGGSGNISSVFNSDDQCVLGSGGPSCMACIDGYVMIDSKCTQCTPSISNVVGAVAGLMVLLFVIFAVLFMKAKEPKDADDEGNNNKPKKTKKGCCGGKKKRTTRTEKTTKKTKEQKIESTRDKEAV